MSINQYTSGNKRLNFYCKDLTAENLVADSLVVDNLEVLQTITSANYTSDTPSNMLINNAGLKINNIIAESLINTETISSIGAAMTGLATLETVETLKGITTVDNKLLVGTPAADKVFPSLNLNAYKQIPNWRYKQNYNTQITGNLLQAQKLLNIKVLCFFSRASFVPGSTEIRVQVSSPELNEFAGAELVSIKGSANPYLATDSTGQYKHPVLLPLSNSSFLTSSILEVRFAVINQQLWYPQTPISTLDDVAINLDINIKIN